MLKEIGQVMAVEDDTVWVQTQSKTSCSSCHVNNACGTGIVSKAFSRKVFVTPVKNSLKAHIHDQVEVGIPEDLVVKTSLIVYLLPLICMMVVLAFLNLSFDGLTEGWLIVGAFVGLLMGFFMTRLIGQNMSKSKGLEPVLLRIVNRSIDVKQIETSA